MGEYEAPANGTEPASTSSIFLDGPAKTFAAAASAAVGRLFLRRGCHAQSYFVCVSGLPPHLEGLGAVCRPVLPLPTLWPPRGSAAARAERRSGGPGYGRRLSPIQSDDVSELARERRESCIRKIGGRGFSRGRALVVATEPR